MKDRWIFGISEMGNFFIVRNVLPRFTAKVDVVDHLSRDEDGEKHVFATGEIMYDFDWQDPEPGGALLRNIMAEAEDAWRYFSSFYAGMFSHEI